MSVFEVLHAHTVRSIHSSGASRKPVLAAAFALAAISAVLALCAPSAWAQSVGAPVHAPMQNVVQLSASANQEIPQDTLQISMNTTREGPDAPSVQTQLKQALDAALQVAKAQALPGQLDVRTGNFSLYPRSDRQGKLTGWQGSAELILEGRDFARITTAAGKIQTLTMGQVAFSLSRDARQKAEADIQAEAIARFRAKADSIAKSFGFSSYSLREVGVSSVDQGYSPRPRAEMMMMAKAASADSPVPAEAGKSVVVVNVSGSVQLK